MQVFYKAKLFNTRDISNTTTHSFFSSLPTKKKHQPHSFKSSSSTAENKGGKKFTHKKE